MEKKVFSLTECLQRLQNKLSVKVPGLGIELLEFMQQGEDPNALQATAIDKVIQHCRQEVEPEVASLLEKFEVVELGE